MNSTHVSGHRSSILTWHASFTSLGVNVNVLIVVSINAMVVDQS